MTFDTIDNSAERETNQELPCVSPFPFHPAAFSAADLTDDEKIDIVAAQILKRFRPAFEELAK